MFENAFNNIDKALRNDKGMATEWDDAEQTAWLLFLKYLDDREADHADTAELKLETHRPILDGAYRWQAWAAPKHNHGHFDHNTAKTGTDLIEFVNRELFPYLQTLRNSAPGVDSLNTRSARYFPRSSAGSAPAMPCAYEHL